MSGTIGIVVVNYASSELIAENLGSTDLAAVRARVVIVDNFSTEGQRREIQRVCADRDWGLVLMESNKGFGAGVNAGVAEAFAEGCDAILLLNPDAQITADCLAQLQQHCYSDPLAMVTPKLLTSTGSPYFHGSQLDLASGHIRGHEFAEWSGECLDAETRHENWVTAACLAFSRTIWERVGGFDESYFLYWEDVDLSYRCVRAGGRVVIRHDLTAVHDEGGTQASTAGAKSLTYYFYNCRNRLLFAKRHLSQRRQWQWQIATPRESWAILLRGGRRQLLHSYKPLFAALRGSVEGLRLLHTRGEVSFREAQTARQS